MTVKILNDVLPYICRMEREPGKVRIDKWLWTVRLFKSRSLASDACEKSRIFVGNQVAKSSRLIRKGDMVQIKRTGLTRIYEVLGMPQTRVSAKMVSEFMTERTPKEDIDNYLSRTRNITIYREPGTGRPTKRERRELDDFLDSIPD
ncbi:MAG: RNA-binding S4 domain-containing protein [Bacteroidia bacterium]|nr:RNA-binding S4 domain-containing protein [Bacteroidia bacterium]